MVNLHQKYVEYQINGLLLPLFLAIVPFLEWENGMARKEGAGGIVIVDATLFVGVDYRHPTLGDRKVMVGDRMVSYVSEVYEPLMNEWTKPGSGRSELEVEELFSFRRMRGQEDWDLKVGFVGVANYKN